MHYVKPLQTLPLSRCLVLVVGGVYLCVMLRVQLNILAGYLHHQETAAASAQHNNNIKSGSISHQMQELFLSVCNNFVTQGGTFKVTFVLEE